MDVAGDTCAATEVAALEDAIVAYRSTLATAIAGGLIAPELGPAVLAAEAVVDTTEAAVWLAEEACGLPRRASFWSTESRYSQSSSQGHLVVRRVETDASETVLQHADTDPHPDHTVWYNPGTLVAGEGYRRALHNVHTTDVDTTTWVFKSQSSWTAGRTYKFHVDRVRYADIRLVASGAPGRDPSAGGGGGGGEHVRFDVTLKPDIEYTVHVSKPFPPSLDITDDEQYRQTWTSFSYVDPVDNKTYVVEAYPGGYHSNQYSDYGSGAGGDGYKPGWSSLDSEDGQAATGTTAFRNTYSYSSGGGTVTSGLSLTSVDKHDGGKGMWTSSSSLGGGGGGALTAGVDADAFSDAGRGGAGMELNVHGTTHSFYYFGAGGGGGGYALYGLAGYGGGGNGGRTNPVKDAGDGWNFEDSFGAGGGGSAYADPDTNVGGEGGGGICVIQLGNAVVPD